jgi:GNAT superfamily N-acetyltransferase
MTNTSIPSASDLLKFRAKRFIVSQSERADRLSLARQDVEGLTTPRARRLSKSGDVFVLQNPAKISAAQFVAANADEAELDIGDALKRDDAVDRKNAKPRYAWKVPVHRPPDAEEEDIAARSDALVTVDSHGTPVGFLSIDVCIGRAGRSWILDFDLPYLFVAKRVRGKGFGLALQVAVEEFSRAVYERIALELPTNHQLACTVSADYASKEGERSALGVLEELMYVREVMLEDDEGAVCGLGEIEIDAGY